MALYDEAAARLAMLGYTVTSNNETALAYAIALASERIKTDINCKEIPDGLHCTLVDMSVGIFLKELKDSGRLTGSELEPIATAKRITEGDISIEFAGASDGSLTPEGRLESLIKAMTEPGQAVLAAYRRLKW